MTQSSPIEGTGNGGIALAPSASVLSSFAPDPSFIQALTLAVLKSQLGPPADAPRAILFNNIQRKDLIRLGQRCRAEEIIGDAPAFFTTAWRIYNQMAPEHQKRLVGFSVSYIAVGVDEAIKLEELNESYDSVARNASRNQSMQTQRLDELMREGTAQRDLAMTALDPYVSAELLGKEQFRSIRSTSDSPDKVAAALREIATLLRAAYSMQPAEIRPVMDEAGLNETYARELESLAQKIKDQRDVTRGRTGQTALSQRELNYQEGRVLRVIMYVYNLFRRAQVVDSSIVLPRINRLGKLFRSHSRGKKDKNNPNTPPNPGTGAASGTAPQGTAPAAANQAAPAAAPAAPAQAPAAPQAPAAAPAAPANATSPPAPAPSAPTTAPKGASPVVRGKRGKKLKKAQKKNRPVAAAGASGTPVQSPQAPANGPPAGASQAQSPPAAGASAPGASTIPPPTPAALSLVTAAVPSLTIPIARPTGDTGAS